MENPDIIEVVKVMSEVMSVMMSVMMSEVMSVMMSVMMSTKNFYESSVLTYRDVLGDSD